jgi:hypothetical protein
MSGSPTDSADDTNTEQEGHPKMSKTDVTAPARLLAVEVLLAEPELLGNDALETDLYILRENLQTTVRPVASAGN